MTTNYISGHGILIYLMNKLSRVKYTPISNELAVGMIVSNLRTGIKARIKEIHINENRLSVECKNDNGNLWSENWNLSRLKWEIEKDIFFIDNTF